MSPRSQEFLAEAHERLAAARDLLATSHPATAVSAAYYAMLYAARAALSEEELYAKTHSGVWSLFSQRFVKTERIDAQHAREAETAHTLRLAGDYDAAAIEAEPAEEIVSSAERFIAAVEAELGG